MAEMRAGTWPPLTYAPSRFELSQRFSVNVRTAGRAHACLAARGLLVRRPGLGMNVLPKDYWQSEA